MQIPPKFRGLFFSILASLCFSGMTAFVHLAGDLPSMQKVLFRNLPALVFTAVILRARHVTLRVTPGNRLSMLGRCAAGTMGVVLNFYAVDHLVLADANMLNKLSPFFAVLFSFFLLGERLSAPQVLGILTAFGGALLIIRPSGGSLTLVPAVCGFLSGLGAGLAYTFVRKMGQHHEDGNRIVFYFSLSSCLFSLPFVLLAGKPMAPWQLASLLMAGLCGAGGQFSITRAYFHAPARELSVYEYLQVLFAAVWGRVLFGQVPDILSFCGYAVIVAAAAVMFLYNNHAGPFRLQKPPRTE